jgi:hypothetical protein
MPASQRAFLLLLGGRPRDSDDGLKSFEIKDFFDLKNVGIRKHIRRSLTWPNKAGCFKNINIC